MQKSKEIMISQVIFTQHVEVFKYSYSFFLPYCHELVAHVYYNRACRSFLINYSPLTYVNNV